MIALILAGAQFLTLSMGYIGLPRALAEWIASLGLSQFGLIIALMVFFVVLGCFLDGISIVVLTMGVLLPTVNAAGIDLIWFGIFLVFVIEMAQITPPVGFNLFVLSGMTKKELPYLARVSLPMFLLMIVGVLLIYFAPEIATWLPSEFALAQRRQLRIMRHQYQRSIQFAVQRKHQVNDPRAVLGVQAACRFIGKQYPGAHHKGARKGNPLLLSPR
jgi:Na+/H+ antiporter NhaD/arsenite permease-like protein